MRGIEAVTARRELGYHRGAGLTLRTLAELHDAAGVPEQATACRDAAAEVLRAIGHPEADPAG
ncbi:MAG: hypothetical protein HOV87_29390 [Catenulispora sp.]|nr:hypothetical protein [Catenulispora sp.]